MAESLTPITVLASDCCDDIGDSNETKHRKFLRHLKDAYQQLHLYISPEIAVKSVIVPASHQVELPCDFIYETKIGLLDVKTNCLATLTLNKQLRIDNKPNSDSSVEQCLNGFFDGSINPSAFMPFFNVFRGVNFLGEMYGFGTGFNCHNWYNIKNGVLEIGGNIPTDGSIELVIEYKSDGISDGLRLVPTQWGLALKHYAKKLYYEDSNTSRAQYFEEQYNIQYFKLKKTYSWRDPEYMALLYKSFDRPAAR